MDKDKLEFKSVPAFTKEIDDRTVIGLAAITGNVDSGGDITHKGAFKKTIAEGTSRVKHLWQHDFFAPPVAAIKELREVGKGELPKELKETFPDATGGLLVSREYLDTERGSEILQGIKTGAINEMSFGFDIIRSDLEERLDEDTEKTMVIRNIREVRLWDTSDVNWGMNAATVAVKSAFAFKLSKLAAYTDEALTELGAVELVHEFVESKAGDVDMPVLIEKLDELLILLRAEPPVALTPADDVLARLEIANREHYVMEFEQ